MDQIQYDIRDSATAIVKGAIWDIKFTTRCRSSLHIRGSFQCSKHWTLTEQKHGYNAADSSSAREHLFGVRILFK